jgi:alkylated DNA nucleotide flippase Atl1
MDVREVQKIFQELKQTALTPWSRVVFEKVNHSA